MSVRSNVKAPDPLATLWDRLRDPALPVIRQTWPAGASLPGLPALERFAPGEAERLRQGHAFLAGLLQAPIVAVAGLINAGKSSLVAAFLSPPGRARVLRGVARRAGTHRFCLWTPAAWSRDAAFRRALERLLTEVFPEPPERLAAEPEAARAQQQSREHLRRPLLAFDPALDAHGLCLLDCPDIQRREADTAAGHQSRLEALRAAGRVCSGVLMVMPRNQLEIVQVAEVLDALPGAFRVAAVNFAGDEPPESILAETRAALGDADLPVYVAYDFTHRGYAGRTPPWDPNLALADAPAPPAALPCFFEARPDPAENVPERVGEERSLLRLAQKFPPDRLLQERQRELLREFATTTRRGLRRLRVATAGETARTHAAVRALHTELAPLLAADGQPRIKLDPALVGDLAESLVRTAPWDVRPFLWASHRTRRMIRSLRKGWDGVGALAGRLRRQIGADLERLRPQVEGGWMDEATVADRLRLWSAACGAHRPREFWQPLAAELLRQFRDQERTDLTPAEWDEFTAALWRDLPKWKTRAAVAGTLAAALAAVALVAFDGGASLVTLVGFKSFGVGTLTVTAKELLGALGFGVIAQGEASRRLQRQLGDRLARQQLANFLALAFDLTGLPRACLNEGAPLPLPEPTLPSCPRSDAFGPAVLNLSLPEFLSASARALEQACARLDARP